MGVREEQRRRTRDGILTAAGVEFAERGYSGASYQSIADRAGVAKSLVSYHFAAKSDLAHAIFESAYPAGTFANTPVEPDDPIDDLVVSTALVAVRTLLDPIAAAGIRLLQDRALIPGPVPIPLIPWVNRTAATIRVAVERGDLPSGVDAELQGRLLTGQYYGLKEVSMLMDEQDVFPGRATRQIVDRLRLLGADPAALERSLERALAMIPEGLS